MVRKLLGYLGSVMLGCGLLMIQVYGGESLGTPPVLVLLIGGALIGAYGKQGGLFLPTPQEDDTEPGSRSPANAGPAAEAAPGGDFRDFVFSPPPPAAPSEAEPRAMESASAADPAAASAPAREIPPAPEPKLSPLGAWYWKQWGHVAGWYDEGQRDSVDPTLSLKFITWMSLLLGVGALLGGTTLLQMQIQQPGYGFWIGGLFCLTVGAALGMAASILLTPVQDQYTVFRSTASPVPVREPITGPEPRIFAEMELEPGCGHYFVNAPVALHPLPNELWILTQAQVRWKIDVLPIGKRAGTWQIMLEPGDVRRLEPGHVYFGRTIRPAVRVEYLRPRIKTPKRVVLSFSTGSDRDGFYAELMRYTPGQQQIPPGAVAQA